jgi:RNA polymerase sigma-70 factor (ECF subfamily)
MLVDDQDDQARWVAPLRTPGPVGDAAARRLRDLLLRAARYQATQMAETQRLDAIQLDEIVEASADQATASVLGRLSEFTGRSKFTTWVYKFGILATAVAVRRAAWDHHELEVDQLGESDTHAPAQAQAQAETVESSEFSREVADAVERSLTPHQRRVALALIVRRVPIDVLADRLATDRNALYKTLHDARRQVRADLMDRGCLEFRGPGKNER